MHSRHRAIARLLLTLTLLSSFCLKLHHLDHPALKGLDESFHAVVAKNFLKHPATPTLIDHPYLPYDYRNWQANHIWLHKPPLPLWQIALSYALLGITPFALRIPSALLATASVYLTYAIGKHLLSRPTALIAAAFQAFLPAITTIAQGYIFSDHVDTALLFYVELAIYFLIRAAFPLHPPGKDRDEGAPQAESRRSTTLFTLACGFATGAAFLCKTYPALIILPLAFTLLFLRTNFRPKHFLILLAATVLALLPWTLYAYFHFPNEFLHENVQILSHLTTNVETFAAPWDRLLFDYLLNAFRYLYPAVIAAMVILLPETIRTRNPRLILLYAWSLGVLIPHLLATSKTPSATLIGWPPLLLLLAEMMTRAFKRDPACIAALLVTTLLPLILRPTLAPSGFGYPSSSLAIQNIWVVYFILAAIAAAFLFRLIHHRLPDRVLQGLTLLAALFTTILFTQSIRTTWRITQQNVQKPAFPYLAAAVDRNLPENAVLLIDQRQKLEYVVALFWTNRTAYPLGTNNWQQLVTTIQQNHGVPYIISSRALPLTPLFAIPQEQLTVYSPQGHDLSNLTAQYPTEINVAKSP
jgi:4-amino-4-deoxy-L-arabinose transferase-like glycosyltransferase